MLIERNNALRNAWKKIGTQKCSYLVIWAWLLTQIEVRRGGGKQRVRMTSEIMVQIVPRKHLWFCHGSHVFGLWDISLPKVLILQFFVWCHLVWQFSLRISSWFLAKINLMTSASFATFIIKRIYIWIRHMAIFFKGCSRV